MLVDGLHQLLYFALVAIRQSARGESVDIDLIWKISDVFHNLPLQLRKVANGELEVEEVWNDILSRARQQGLEVWLGQMMKNAGIKTEM